MTLAVSKPDDTPNHAWVAALNAGQTCTSNDDFVRIARAIMAETEWCAKLCENFAGTDSFDASTSRYLAEEIRKRNEP